MAIKATHIVEWCERQLRQKDTWLRDHGPKSKKPRPEMEIDNKREDIEILEAVLADYRAAIKARKNPG